MSHNATVTAGFMCPPLRRPGGERINATSRTPLKAPMTASAIPRSATYIGEDGARSHRVTLTTRNNSTAVSPSSSSDRDNGSGGGHGGRSVGALMTPSVVTENDDHSPLR